MASWLLLLLRLLLLLLLQLLLQLHLQLLQLLQLRLPLLLPLLRRGAGVEKGVLEASVSWWREPPAAVDDFFWLCLLASSARAHGAPLRASTWRVDPWA